MPQGSDPQTNLQISLDPNIATYAKIVVQLELTELD